MRAALLVAITLALGGCIDPIDPAWQLDHDHVVAVRASSPGVARGESAVLDALVAHAGAPTTLELPAEAAAIRAADYLQPFVTGARVDCPDDATLARARLDLGLAADAPVLLDVYMAFPHGAGEPMFAKKTVWLGEHRDNPALPQPQIDGSPMADQLTVPMTTDVYLSVDVDPAWRVSWLSSVGTLFQDDVATSFLRVAPEDPRMTGELAVVIRDPAGGVAWRVWPIQAAAP